MQYTKTYRYNKTDKNDTCIYYLNIVLIMFKEFPQFNLKLPSH